MFLSVGDTLQLPYDLKTSVPAGCAHLDVQTGQTAAANGSLHVELVARHGGQDTSLVSFDQPIVATAPHQIGPTPLNGQADHDVQLDHLAAAVGDQIIVTVRVNASTDPVRLFVNIDLPAL